MKILKGFNVICKSVVMLERVLNQEEIQLYSNYDISIPVKGEIYNLPNSKVRTDTTGRVKGKSIELGYPYDGLLKDQTSVKANTLYRAKISSSNDELDYVLATVDKNWVLGTSIPDVSFKHFNIKTLFTS